MKEPFALYKRCEKDGAKGRCATHPNCDCDYYDRPSRPDGRRPWVHLPETARNKQLAYKLALKKRQDEVLITEGLKARPKPPAPLLSTRLAAYYAVDAIKAQKTFATKLQPTLDGFLAHVGDRPIDKVTREMIESWRVMLLARPSKKQKESGGTLSRNTVQRTYNSVKGFFTWCAEEDDEFTSPCAKLADMSEDPAERVLWQPDQLWLIEELADRFRLPLKVGYLCGCRRTEALLLTKHDLSPKGWSFPGSSPKLGWIGLQRKKKKRGMVKVRVPIALSIVTELHAQLKSPFQQHVFGDPPPDPNAWSSNLTRALRALGEKHQVDVAGLCMHGTRHTATTSMQDMPGVSATTAKNMGGWTTTRMVETYSSPAEASMQVAASGLARLYRPRKPKDLKGTTAGRKRA